MEDDSISELLKYLKAARGFDFSGYKRSTLTRRIQKAMTEVGASTVEDYLAVLQSNPAEFSRLFNTILINVTSFFRDAPAWEFIAQTILPALIQRDPSQPIRCWSVGCATGQEPYTLALLTAHEMGLEEYLRRVKIFATDVDESALDEARRARYSQRDLEPLPEGFRDRYFLRENAHFSLHPAIRRTVIFGRHDLMDDAPIPHVDFMICRNTLMYFNAEAQAHILNRLHFALNETGFLFLGRAEMLLTKSHLFRPVEMRHRIFSKVVPSGTPFAIPVPFTTPRDAMRIPSPHEALLRDLSATAFDSAPLAQIVLEKHRRIALFNLEAQRLFNLSPDDRGRPFQDLELSYRPVELRSLIDQACEAKEAVHLEKVERNLPGSGVQYLDVVITPLRRDETTIGVNLSFADVTDEFRVHEERQRFAENLEAAYEELQAANEEMETTNEELQAANEELETTNEELQASNEEMETMNEELRATNESLSIANDQLRQHESDLHTVNSFLQCILESIEAGMVVLDQNWRVHAWNGQAAELWGVRAEEAEGQSLRTLDIGLPLDQVEPAVNLSFSHTSRARRPIRLQVPALNRRGRSFQCRVTVAALQSNGEQKCVILLMEDEASQEDGSKLSRTVPHA